MSLNATRLNSYRANVPDFDKYEVTTGDNGAFRVFQSQTASPTGIITPELQEKAKLAIGNTLEIPVLNKETFTIQNVTQPVVITGGPSTSALYEVTFVDYYFGFRIFPALHFNNEISMQREFNRKLKGYEYAMLEALNAAGLATLEADKTQVVNDLLGKYVFAGNIVTGDYLERDEMVGDMNLIFKANNMPSRLDVVGNYAFDSIVRNRLKEQGQANERNKTYQYDDKQFFSTKELTNAAGTRATAIGIAKDSIGIVQRQSADAVLGNKSHNSEWSLETLPITGLQMSMKFYDGDIDGSGLSSPASDHLTSTLVQAYGFYTSIGFITAYNSDRATIPSPITKFAILNP